MNGTLLLVEDDANLAAAISTKLSQHEYAVLHADTGAAGLELASRRQPDLLLLDLMLPDYAGEDILRHVREQSNVPVIIISAKDHETARITGLEIGADDYLTKPFSLRELVERVRAVLRRSRLPAFAASPMEGAVEHSRLVCGGVELALDSREATVDGSPVDLSPTEFKLLRYFMEHAGKAVSTDQVINAVWGYNGYDRHIVEANIYRLRSKIEEDRTQPRRLVTVRGFGYKFGSNGQGSA